MSLVHQIALTMMKGVGPMLAKQLLNQFGSAEAVFAAKRHQILQIEGIGVKIAQRILQNNALEKAAAYLPFLKKHQIKILFYTDEGYPKRLRQCYDAPLILYYKGTIDLNHPKIISIVGTRNATAYGKLICRQLLEALSIEGVVVLSGLAYGIDATAHRESLNLGVPTIAVLGHGLDRIYPAAHRDLAQKMLQNGGLLTEFLPGTKPDRENFPKRNRIIAGLAVATIVVEASMKGGALITAEIANSYNRDVFAIPGRVTDEYAEGCNFLIKTNRAALINGAKDLIYNLGWDDERPKKNTAQIQLPLELSETAQKIVDQLAQQNLEIDQLVFQTQIPQSKLAMSLLTLEMQGIIIALPGKVYKLA
ncbi:MAG: DNA-processing protein DprA [Pedobacter sp.]|nr:DNA-processing protein DprA [Pedobacter sp.]